LGSRRRELQEEVRDVRQQEVPFDSGLPLAKNAANTVVK
jgi:hypothetical protein